MCLYKMIWNPRDKMTFFFPENFNGSSVLENLWFYHRLFIKFIWKERVFLIVIVVMYVK